MKICQRVRYRSAYIDWAMDSSNVAMALLLACFLDTAVVTGVRVRGVGVERKNFFSEV